MKTNLSFRIWLRAQRRRIVGLFILVFSAKFMVVSTWKSGQKPMQSQHWPGHIGFIVSLTDVRKLDKLIKLLESIRADMVHRSKHHSGVSVRNTNKGR